MCSQSASCLKRTISQVLGLATLVFIAGWPAAGIGGDPIATLRNAAIDIGTKPPQLSNPVNQDVKQVRNYPEQPPIIPHSIRDYQLDLNVNKCMNCHSRRAVERSQAPMVSITHFTDRDNQVLASISPRRYFCTQCHVTQINRRPLTGNTFVDVEHVGANTGN